MARQRLLPPGKQGLRLYLAGPESLLHEPDSCRATQRHAIRRLNARKLWPFTFQIVHAPPQLRMAHQGDLAAARRLYRNTLALLNEADCAVANLIPFRGSGMDTATALTIGILRGKGKPVCAYWDPQPFRWQDGPPAPLYEERICQHYDVSTLQDGMRIGPEGCLVESFGLADSHMPLGVHSDFVVGDVAASLSEAVALLGEWFAQRIR